MNESKREIPFPAFFPLVGSGFFSGFLAKNASLAFTPMFSPRALLAVFLFFWRKILRKSFGREIEMHHKRIVKIILPWGRSSDRDLGGEEGANKGVHRTRHHLNKVLTSSI